MAPERGVRDGDRPAGSVFAPTPAIIGHRGLGAGDVDGRRENTLDSCLAAVDAGVGWVEVDARRSADDVIVVGHNPTTGDGEFIVDQAADSVTAKGVARLADILDGLPPSVGVNVDVKSELEDAVCPAASCTDSLLAPLLAARRDVRPLFVSSFDPALLLRLREELPRLPLGLLAWIDFPLRHAVPAAARLGLDAVCLHAGSFGPNRIEHHPEVHRPPKYSVQIAHEAGLQVLAWCPEPERVESFADAGVDAICVNDVPRSLAALAPA